MAVSQFKYDVLELMFKVLFMAFVVVLVFAIRDASFQPYDLVMPFPAPPVVELDGT